jgi:putative ABC transport system permease protein
MIRHLVRLMWNRKRQNLLLMAEVFVAFLVVVAVAVLAMHFGNNARQSLGFTIERVWTIEVDRGRDRRESRVTAAQDRDVVRRMLVELRGLSGVEQVAAAFTGPYRAHSWNEVLRLEGRAEFMVSTNRVDDAFGDILGVSMVAGRWFSREDDGASWEPVVINQALARTVFGTTDPVGQTIRERPPTRRGPLTPASSLPKRVVGVIRDFRQFGELSTPGPVLMYRLDFHAPEDRVELPEILLVRVTPRTTAAFEEPLVRRLAAIAPTWSIGVQDVGAQRDAMLNEHLVPLAIVVIVAGSLLLMVALGLTGVVWQSVTQRMREFGLRRAQGATGADVGRQVIAELVVMTAFPIALGLILIAQIPLIPVAVGLTLVPRPVFMAGVLVAVVAVSVVTIACAWYPSRLAARVPPAEALHYE